MLVLDHLAGPSRVVTGIIKEFSDYGRRPIYFAARTPHMKTSDPATHVRRSLRAARNKEFRSGGCAGVREERAERTGSGPQTSIPLCTRSSNGAREIPAASCRCSKMADSRDTAWATRSRRMFCTLTSGWVVVSTARLRHYRMYSIVHGELTLRCPASSSSAICDARRSSSLVR